MFSNPGTQLDILLPIEYNEDFVSMRTTKFASYNVSMVSEIMEIEGDQI